MVMIEVLTDTQLMLIVQNDMIFDRILPSLPDALRAALSDLQMRAGNTYIEGTWDVSATGDRFTNPDCSQPPTAIETLGLLTEVHGSLTDQNPFKSSVWNLLRDLALSPTEPAIEVRPANKNIFDI